MDSTIKARQASLRDRRVADGWRRVDTWIRPDGLTLSEASAELVKLAMELDAATVSPETALAVARARIWDLSQRLDV